MVRALVSNPYPATGPCFPQFVRAWTVTARQNLVAYNCRDGDHPQHLEGPRHSHPDQGARVRR